MTTQEGTPVIEEPKHNKCCQDDNMNCKHSEDVLDEASQMKRSPTLKPPEDAQREKLLHRPSFRKDKIDAHYDRLPWALAAIGRLLGLKFAPINIPLERRLQTFAVFFWMSVFLFMGFGSIFMLIATFAHTRFWWISICYLSFFLGDYDICNRGGRRWQWVRKWKLWKHFADFFPAKIIKTTDYDPNKNYIFGYHPHGILSAGAMANFGTEGTNFSELFPGLTPHLLVLGGHFLFPIYRDFLMCSGAVSVSKASVRHLLSQEQKGKALCLVVGGAPESLDCHPGDIYLHLNKRRGFCKLAIQHGASLVPTFSFGENDIYDQVPNPPGSLIRALQDFLQKLIGLAPCLFLGRGIFQYSFGIVPFRKPINTVFGAPIAVPKIHNPTSEQICELHKRYIDAVIALFNKYKDQYNEDTNAKIYIV